MKTVQPVIALNGISYLKMASIGSYSTSEREKKKIKKERMGNLAIGLGFLLQLFD